MNTARPTLALGSLAIVVLGSLAPEVPALGGHAVDPAAVRRDVEGLCNPAWRGRLFGSPGGKDAARHVAGRFRAIGLKPLAPGYLHPFESGGKPGFNVLGRLPGRGPGPRQTVILEAHFDHVGDLSPGASDNAAGVACILAAARVLAAGPPLRHDVLFASFDGEEEGFLGANAYVANPAVPLDRTAAFVVLDAMGRRFADLPKWRLTAFGTESSADLETMMRSRQARAPHLAFLSTDVIGPRSDYVPFAAARIPHLFFFNGTYPEYHDIGDTPDKIDYPRLATDAALIAGVIRDLADARKSPAFRTGRALPDDLANLRALWVDLAPIWPRLPASLSAEVPGLTAALRAKPDNRQVMRAFDVAVSAATPWYGEMLVAMEAGNRLEREGDRRAAAAAFRRTSQVVRAPVGKRYFAAKAAALEGSGPQVTPIPGRDSSLDDKGH